MSARLPSRPQQFPPDGGTRSAGGRHKPVQGRPLLLPCLCCLVWKLVTATPRSWCWPLTRELALQVAEACQRYAHHMPDFHVLPIYGGAPYETPDPRPAPLVLRVVVGTPGRVMDLIRRKNLDPLPV